MKSHAFGKTDIGLRREANQDHFVVDDALGLYAVADGMGGHAAGEVASQIAIEALSEVVRSNGVPETTDDAERSLTRALREGNRRIFESVLEREDWRGMGTTIVALLEVGEHALIGHVGDSRAYLLRDGRLERLTEDHSWVSEQVRLGLLTSEEAARHPMRNIVTRALGNREDVEVEVRAQTLRPGDVILLCSDGLNSMLFDDEILEALRSHARDPRAACEDLIDRANARGGEDNVTVIVATLG
jgi:protein phosphatase